MGTKIARALGCEDARVVVIYRRSNDAAASMVAEIGTDSAEAVRADVTDDADVQRFFAEAREHFGAPVTTVVNNALVDLGAKERRDGVEPTAARCDTVATDRKGGARG